MLMQPEFFLTLSFGINLLLTTYKWVSVADVYHRLILNEWESPYILIKQSWHGIQFLEIALWPVCPVLLRFGQNVKTCENKTWKYNFNWSYMSWSWFPIKIRNQAFSPSLNQKFAIRNQDGNTFLHPGIYKRFVPCPLIHLITPYKETTF